MRRNDGAILEACRNFQKGNEMGKAKEVSQEPCPARLLRRGEVKQRVGLSDVTIFRMEREGTFPKHIRIGRCALWAEAEIDAFIAARLATRGGTA